MEESGVPDSASPRSSPTTAMTRWSLWLLAGVALIIGATLMVFPDRTDRYFAWTIRAPIAAGATLMLLTTIIHRAAFNWGAPVAWIWLAIYLLGPPLYLALAVRLGLPSAGHKAAMPHAST